MAKSFKIAINPTFTAVVDIPRIGADPIAVKFTFKAMNRVQLAKLFTKWTAAQQKLVDEGADFTLQDWAEKEIDMQVEQLKDIVVGWGFEDEFNDENIEALVSTLIDVTSTITDCYGEAYARARRGN